MLAAVNFKVFMIAVQFLQLIACSWQAYPAGAEFQWLSRKSTACSIDGSSFETA
jgi:hypothetical protein